MNSAYSRKEDIIEELIILAQAGDKNAFRKIIDQNSRFAFAVAFKILLNEDDARDAAQEAFIKLWKSLNNFKFEAKFTTWFYKIIVNTSLDKLKQNKRKQKTFQRLSDLEESGLSFSKEAEDYSNYELAGIIKALASKLSPKQKLVFTLRDLNGMELKEVSGSLNMSVNSVKVNLVHARKKIKEYLANIYKRK